VKIKFTHKNYSNSPGITAASPTKFNIIFAMIFSGNLTEIHRAKRLDTLAERRGTQ